MHFTSFNKACIIINYLFVNFNASINIFTFVCIFLQGYIKALHVYDQDGLTAFEKMILSELESLNKRIEEFGGKEFNVLALSRRSLTNVISVLVLLVLLYLTRIALDIMSTYEKIKHFVQR